MHVQFKKPFNFEGEEYGGVDIDLDSLSGDDLERAQELISLERKTGGVVPEFSKAYLAQVAALAAKKPVEFFRALPARESVKVTIEVQNFLLDGASEVGNKQ
jgi:hypothetical protein